MIMTWKELVERVEKALKEADIKDVEIDYIDVAHGRSRPVDIRIDDGWQIDDMQQLVIWN